MSFSAKARRRAAPLSCQIFFAVHQTSGEEVCAVQAVHGVVPTAANEQEEDHAAAPAKAKKLLRILSEHEVDGKQEPRQEETDRPFREDGEPCKEEGGVVAHTFS